MKAILGLVAAVSMAWPTQAQQVMDGSAPDGMATEMAGALVGKATDPYSAQFTQMKKKGEDVCGLVNLRNQNGGYTGFQPFLFSQGQMFLNQTTPCR